MELSCSHNPSHGFDKLTRIGSGWFFVIILIDFFSISSFNIEVVGN